MANGNDREFIPPERTNTNLASSPFQAAVAPQQVQGVSNFFQNLLSGQAGGAMQQASNEAFARASANQRAQAAAGNLATVGQGAAVSAQRAVEGNLAGAAAANQLDIANQNLQLQQQGAQGLMSLAGQQESVRQSDRAFDEGVRQFEEQFRDQQSRADFRTAIDAEDFDRAAAIFSERTGQQLDVSELQRLSDIEISAAELGLSDAKFNSIGNRIQQGATFEQVINDLTDSGLTPDQARSAFERMQTQFAQERELSDISIQAARLGFEDAAQASAFEDTFNYLDSQVVADPTYMAEDKWMTDENMLDSLENMWSAENFTDDSGNPIAFDMGNAAHEAWASSQLTAMSTSPEQAAANRFFASDAFTNMSPEQQEETRELLEFSQLIKATGGFQMKFSVNPETGEEEPYIVDSEGEVVFGERFGDDVPLNPSDSGFVPEGITAGEYFERNGVLYESQGKAEDPTRVDFDPEFDDNWSPDADRILRLGPDAAGGVLYNDILQERVKDIRDGGEFDANFSEFKEPILTQLLADDTIPVISGSTRSVGEGTDRRRVFNGFPSKGNLVRIGDKIYRYTDKDIDNVGFRQDRTHYTVVDILTGAKKTITAATSGAGGGTSSKNAIWTGGYDFDTGEASQKVQEDLDRTSDINNVTRVV